MLLLVTLALTVSVFATWTFLTKRLDDQVNAELLNESRKFRSYVQNTPREDLDTLLTRYLTVNTPDRYETFFTILDGEPHRRTFASPPAALHTDTELVRRLAAADRPTVGQTDSTAGEVRYAVIPLRAGQREAALVVAVFHELHRKEVTDTVRAVAVIAVAALGLAGAAGWFVAGRVLAPVRLVRQAAERISGSADLTRRLDVTGNDDVAALAATFNRMLDRLERSFAVQREFMDDAGHELRTPITVIRGHLELMGDDPQDRAETIALVTDELARMNRIVEDLLTLAKSEHPDFITLEEVELADLTVSVLAKARGLGERNWRVDEVAEVSLHADEQRLTQAMMQLIANAVRHTEPGDVVAVGSAVRGAEVELWVRDSGPGVRPQDRERIFGRFARGGSRPRDSRRADGRAPEGAGLGLAIVRSIAEAHGGRVRVEDAPGGGALFVITLPLSRHDADHERPSLFAEEIR